MLSDYKDMQSIAYNTFVNELNNDSISHAYLIDENGYSESFDMILSFVKSILCKNKINGVNCNKCFVCERINKGNYPEIKIIEPDGMLIRKQQVLDLQKEFSRSSVEGSKLIYIIRDCDRMRPETTNSMLKFLEEPVSNVVAILMTNNYNSILPTIISRCQVIKLNNNSTDIVDKELQDIVYNFLYQIEKYGIKALIDTKNLWFKYIESKDRDKMVMAFDIMINLYYDILKLYVFSLNENNVDERILEIYKLNDKNKILKKINYLIEAKDSIKYNVNSGLLIDSLIVNIGGNYEGSWN